MKRFYINGLTSDSENGSEPLDLGGTPVDVGGVNNIPEHFEGLAVAYKSKLLSTLRELEEKHNMERNPHAEPTISHIEVNEVDSGFFCYAVISWNAENASIQAHYKKFN